MEKNSTISKHTTIAYRLRRKNHGVVHWSLSRDLLSQNEIDLKIAKVLSKFDETISKNLPAASPERAVADLINALQMQPLS